MLPLCENLVMVVEDDRDVREALVEALQDHAYQPVEVANGKEAIERLRTGGQRPCVILLDMMMPVMDGWQFRAIQRTDPDLDAIPVVVLSAHADVAEAADRMGVAACLRKPVTLEALLEIVDRFCRPQQP
jgi:CheY-like chemotaxis protein